MEASDKDNRNTFRKLSDTTIGGIAVTTEQCRCLETVKHSLGDRLPPNLVAELDLAIKLNGLLERALAVELPSSGRSHGKEQLREKSSRETSLVSSSVAKGLSQASLSPLGVNPLVASPLATHQDHGHSGEDSGDGDMIPLGGESTRSDDDDRTDELIVEWSHLALQIENNLSSHQVVMEQVQIYGMTFRRLREFLCSGTPQLSNIPALATNLLIVLQTIPQTRSLFANLDRGTAKMLVDRASTEDKESPAFDMETSIANILSDLKGAGDDLDDQNETLAVHSLVNLSPFDLTVQAMRRFDSATTTSTATSATREEVKLLRDRIIYTRQIRHLVTNILHIAVWVKFASNLSMDLLFGGKYTEKEEKLKLLQPAQELWNLVLEGRDDDMSLVRSLGSCLVVTRSGTNGREVLEFDPTKLTLLCFVEIALVPGLAEHEQQALKVAAEITRLSSDLRRGRRAGASDDRTSLMHAAWSACQQETLSGRKGAPVKDDYTGSTDNRNNICCLAMNVIAHRSITKRLPQGLFNGEFICTLSLVSPFWIRTHCDFFSAKKAAMKGFFGKTTPLGEGDKIVTNISKGLKPRLKKLSLLYFETLKVELIFNQPLQVKSLKDLIGCTDTDQTDGGDG
ncbi:hypothetical protein THAOC_34796 [Thalassiosira oceanica]|uniref:Uncharacterized protein n=1 Tax=Thalassiosira oceanica TaxID=159749 RepID=K0R4F1_THAOC|nr:hypothetical protein THAOC_34796 [Thalassiosira oceanica]|eukprot:EJK46534.1 hypothetical protein THAOC_34796 [Thalassiosira oceanica]